MAALNSEVPLERAVYGVRLAVEGVSLVFSRSRLFRAQWKLWLPIAGVFVAIYVIGHLLLLPMRVITGLLSAGVIMDTVDAIFYEILTSLPFVCLMFLRYVLWSPLDSLFQLTLAQVNPAYCDALYRLETASTADILKSFMLRTIHSAKWAILVIVLSYIPVIGYFAYPASELAILWRSFGLPTAIVISLLNCIPFVHVHAKQVARILFAGRALARELLEPYFIRTWPSEAFKREFFRKNGSLLFGFALPFVVLVNIPMVGPLAFLVAQAAIASVVVLITEPPTKRAKISANVQPSISD